MGTEYKNYRTIRQWVKLWECTLRYCRQWVELI